MKYFIFRRNLSAQDKGQQITFNFLSNPYNNTPVRIEADNLDQAAEKAADFLQAAEIATYDVKEGHFYFVAQVGEDDVGGDSAGLEVSAFLVHSFRPVPTR